MSRLESIEITRVWGALGGPDPRHGRVPAFWRRSADLNISINADRAVWFDHVNGCGGGPLNLVETVLNCDRRQALKWLQSQGFLESRTSTPEARRIYSERATRAKSTAEDIEHWRAAYISELNRRKVAAMETEDDDELAFAAKLCDTLENGSAEEVAQQYIQHLRTAPEDGTAPEDVKRLIAIGAKETEHVRQTAARVVFFLTEAVLREDSNHGDA